MIIKKELVRRQIAGETILVPIGTAVYDSGGLFVLNELGDFIWGLLPKVDTEEEICKAVVAQYEVSEAEAARDIRAFLKDLERMGIIDAAESLPDL